MSLLKNPANPPRISSHRFLTQRINDIAGRLISPGDLLRLDRLASEQSVRANPHTPHIMDKRHPSSFQQLEKVPHDGWGLVADHRS